MIETDEMLDVAGGLYIDACRSSGSRGKKATDYVRYREHQGRSRRIEGSMGLSGLS